MYVTIPMKLASCYLSIGGGHLSYPLYLLWTRVHAFRTVFNTKEWDPWAFKLQFLAVPNEPFYLGHIEEVDEVGIMVFLGGAIDHYVIMDTDDSRAPFHDKVHFHLEDILWYFGSKGHFLESVSAFVCVYDQ